MAKYRSTLNLFAKHKIISMTPKEALEKFRDAIERSDARALELMINSKERPRPLELVEENDDVKITDFKNSNGENIFDILSNNYTDKDKDLKLFLLLLKTLPEYQNVTKIPFFFFYADEKKSNNISSTARFKPVTATAGNPWQSSISPESALKKKIIAIDASFFQKNNSPTLQNRKMLQITRMLREGFSILYRNSNDQLVELRDNFDKDELLKLKPFKEEDYEFLAEASDTRDPIARSQVLPLDESRSKSLETLFCAPFNTVSFQDLHSKDATFYNKEFVSLYFKIDETDSQDILRKASSNISGVIEDLGKMDKETRIKFITLFVASGNLELIKKILESFKYMYAVAQNAAAQNGHVGVIKLLLENGVKINDMHTALYAAAHNGHAEVVELLLDNKVSVNGKSTGGWTALYAAACNSHAKVVELLLDNGAIINEKNPGGWTALNVTAKNGHVEVVKLLIARGANVNEKTTDNWTALHIATYNGHAEVAKLLIARGANIKEKNKDNWTALHIAAYNGHAKVVELLLDNGAIINEKTANNSNALYVAAQNGHAEVVELLLDNGANINEKTAGGWTALHIAEHNGHTEVAELLTAHGAKKINYHRTAPPHTNNLNINIGPLSNKSHDKVTDTSNDRFDMYKVGSLLNPNQQKFSHPARLRVSVSIMDFPENDIASYKTLAAKNLTEVKDFATTLVKNNKIYQEQIEQYKEERNVAYYEIQYRVKKSKSLHQLFSVNYSGVDLAQITVPKGVEITQLSKDEFGFYHIATSKPCIIKYVLKFNPQQPEISESNPIKQLADEYQRNVERAKTSTEVVPTLENNDYDKFYEKVFKSGKGSCILRTAAFVREVEKKFPNIKIGQDFIVENIDRNHTAIGVIENGQISYLELGGINSANVVNHSSNYYKTGVDGLLITLSEAASKITSRLQRSAIEKFLRRIKNYFTRSNKIGIAPITKEETINTNTGQNSSTKKQPSTKPNSLASFCQQNVATENYQNLAQEQDLQNLLHDSNLLRF